MFTKKNSTSFFIIICISTLISCSYSNKQESNTSHKKITVGKVMKDQTNNEKSIIKLYIYPNCPYCKKVINFLRTKNNLEKITLVDVTNKTNMQELLEVNNGNTQCPFLFDTEKNIKMLESDDIIQYLSTRF